MKIPEDIMATTSKAVEEWLPPRDVRDAAIDSFDMNGLEDSVKDVIARAILEERQRCADVLRTCAKNVLSEVGQASGGGEKLQALSISTTLECAAALLFPGDHA